MRRSELDAAVRKGILTPEQSGALADFLAKRPDERSRFSSSMCRTPSAA
jgi:hypothetical protein